MAIINPARSCRVESGAVRCSHSEHDAETPHRFDVVTATGRPVPEPAGFGLPILDGLMRDVFGS